ncbi:IclR family transcriptional regulator [Mycolicibacterium komossense]|uniref:IclR family transcriptional regulator n=1 Tax=Mycolicibacterium komossense TaxID=1779 RepID=A0ABT3CJE4_9MYCO|nr:IclR family transcriptional regulator [Mycolicibacterium komossense]MCV7229482.1 IclR family transcriptional regulator [Mycolicibacterium komossense]
MAEGEYRIQSLARGLSVLSEVANSDGELTAAELSRRVGVSTQTAYHLLHTLRQTGYVEQNSSQRYRLGRAIPALIDGYKRQFSPPDAVLRRLRRLKDATGETCSLSAWSGDDVELVAQEAGDHTIRVADIQVGQRGALHARAAGKILLARADEDKRKRVLQDILLKKFTEHTITRRAKLEEALQRARDTGWAMDDEEFSSGLTCVAACLDHDGTDFALAILAPTERLKANFDHYLATLLDVTSNRGARRNG